MYQADLHLGYPVEDLALAEVVLRLLCWDSVQDSCSKLTCISAILSRIRLWLRYSDYCVGTVYKSV